MTKKIVSGIYGVLFIYLIYLVINAFSLMNASSVSTLNITIYLILFSVNICLLIVLYDLINNDRFIRFVLMVQTIINLNYFIMGFFMRMVPSSNDTWSGPVHSFYMLVTKIDFSEATLIEYNLYYQLPMWINIVAIILIGIGLVGRRIK